MSDLSTLSYSKRDALIPLRAYTSNELVINEVASNDLVARKKTRARIYELQTTLEASVATKKGLKKEMGTLTHRFISGVYARELFIPAGTIMVSQLHKFPRVCIISQGEVSFTTEYGTQRVRAPYTAVFKAGSKVALFTHSDTVWTAVIRTDKTDVSEVLDEIIAKDHEEYNAFCINNNLGIGEE